MSTENIDLNVDVDALGSLGEEGEEKTALLETLRPSAEEANAEIGMEAFSLLFSGTKFMKELGGTISSFTSKMSDMASGLVSKITPSVMKSNSTDIYAVLEDLAAQANHATLARSIKLVNPPKMSGNWMDYAIHLNAMVDVVSTIDKDVLSPLAEYLAKGINSPDTFLSNTYTPKYVEKDIKKFQATMKGFFKGTPQEFVYWGSAFRRNSEVPLFINNLIEAKRKSQVLQPETVAKSVSVIAERAKLIAEKFAQPTSGMKLNQKHSKMLSEIIFYAANMVELYTVVIQLVYELDQCVKYSMEKIEQNP